ncbi:hypothetical protein BLA60_13305 [Actinophytocola xinjiangensis]|uniref:Mce-associated membrane protein n=1 Tax=Actinophytocola xinjiangensis TaxID=485602 RepID=A0A7Z0WMI2_9PSEU|nr:hypothetical protein [Actinophytocola xinjiangensis]OLF10993.1 hypothetical protein BLA60_13305 [Actinophytocola xinjiangensis]
MTSPADSDVNHDVEGSDDSPDSVEVPEVEETAEPEPAPGSDSRTKLPSIVLAAAVALLVAAVGVAGWFGVAWFRAANDDGLEYSAMRVEVDRQARIAVETMNTLDYRELEDGLARWSAVTTGTLNAEITRLTDEDKKSLTDAKWVTRSKVRSLAVRELDDRGGKAIVIAAVETTLSLGGGEPKTDFKRVEGTLLRTENGWKLDVLTPVQSAQQPPAEQPAEPAAPPSR